MTFSSYQNSEPLYSYIKQINDRRPLVITQGGKGVAVVLNVAECEAMQDKLE